MLRKLIVVLTGAVVLSPVNALGCTLSPFPPPPICERFWQGDAVALVEVTNITQTPSSRRVTLRVLDVYRGDPPLSLTFEDPLTSCGAGFGRKGQHLAWFFKDEDGTWSGYGDYLSRGVGTDSGDLRYAQAMKSAPGTGRIYGTLDKPRQGLFAEEVLAQPVSNRAGTSIIAKGSAGIFEAAVTPDFTFDLPNLPGGEYTVEVAGLPANLAVDAEQVELHGGGCQGLFLFSGSSARVTGRVFGSGKPIGSAWVNLVPLDANAARATDITDAETGAFEFEQVQPGRYILGFSLRQAPTLDVPYASRYYPNTKDAAAAHVFEVREGEQINNIEFDLGSEDPRRRVHVRVLWKDGSPAPKATTYLGLTNRSYFSDQEIETDANGEAVLEGFVDIDYDVEADAVCVEAEDSRDIDKKVIAASVADTFVELQVNGPKCVLAGKQDFSWTVRSVNHDH